MRLEAPHFIEFDNLVKMENDAIEMGLQYTELREQNKAFYQGYILKAKKWGPGIMQYENGSTYEGEWKDDMREGRGKHCFENGDVYEGRWERNEMSGYGVLV